MIVILNVSIMSLERRREWVKEVTIIEHNLEHKQFRFFSCNCIRKIDSKSIVNLKRSQRWRQKKDKVLRWSYVGT